MGALGVLMMPHLALSETEWSDLEAIARFLMPFLEATEELCSQLYSSVSKV